MPENLVTSVLTIVGQNKEVKNLQLQLLQKKRKHQDLVKLADELPQGTPEREVANKATRRCKTEIREIEDKLKPFFPHKENLQKDLYSDYAGLR